MGSVDLIQNSFVSGEISPFALGRSDVVRYAHAVEELTNYIITPLGAIRKRPGTKWAHKVKNGATKVARLHDFQFSTVQAYVLEFSENAIRFFKDNAIITQTAQNITGITKANPAVVTYSGSDTYANGDSIIISGVVGMVEVNDREFTVANVNTGANTFELSGVNSTSYTTYSSGGTVAEIVEVTTTYAESELFDLSFAQSADTLYIVHPDHKPAKLTRSSHTSWTLADVTFADGPYEAENTTGTTMTLSATSGSITITASAATFTSDDVGRLFRSHDTVTAGWALITGFTSTTVVSATVGSTFGTAAAKTTWRLGSWSNARGWPAAVAFHQQRLFYANTVTDPQKVWGSETDSFDSFSPTELAPVTTVSDDNAVTFNIASNKVKAIHWMVSFETLLMGSLTTNDELKPLNSSAAIAPDNIDVKERVYFGSSSVYPAKIGTTVIFSDRSGRAIRRLARSDLALDAFDADDISILAEHLFREGEAIKQIAYQQNPYSTVWILCTSGQLFGMAYNHDQDIVGFFRYVPGGTLSGATQPAVESIAVIPTSDGTEDQLWLSVKRTMNSATVRSVEYMNTFFFPTSASNRSPMYFVDAGATYDGSAATTITGLGFLAGETISVVGDGVLLSSPTSVGATSDRITLSSAKSVVHVGYGYNAQGKTLPPEAGNPKGSAQGRMQKIDHMTFRVLNSMMLKVGRDYSNLFPLPGFTEATGDLVSDDLRTPTGMGHSRRAQFVWRQDKPYESVILCLMPELDVTQK